MAECFHEVSTENTEKFFMNMIVSDVSMPHTQQRLSPITFNDFLIRNQICTIAPFSIYDEANKIWRKFLKINGQVLQATARKDVDLDQADTPHPGWNVMTDYINRLLEVEKWNKYPFYQMHYLAHVSHNFYRETEKMEQVKCTAYRSIWNEILGPILYEPLVPTQYAWLPIENYADIRFASDLMKTIANCNIFINNHTGRLMNHQAYDAARVEQIKADCEQTITAIYANKYKQDQLWLKPIGEFIGRNQMRKFDAELCEMYPQFKVIGLKIVDLFSKIDKFSRHFEEGLFADDPDEAIDELLDIRPKSEDVQNIDLDKEIPTLVDQMNKEASEDGGDHHDKED